MYQFRVVLRGVSPLIWRRLLDLRAGDAQERLSQHGQADVSIPGIVAMHFILVEPYFIFARLECLVDRPAGALST